MTVNDGSVLGAVQIYGSAPRNRAFNIVLLAEGFTAAQQQEFNTAADTFVSQLVKTAPFDDFTAVINAFRVNITSTDSGADDPLTTDGGLGTTADTYFDASFGLGGVQRIMSFDTTRALQVAAAQVPEFTAALVVVNSTIYGGSGGMAGIYSLALGSSDIGMHEMGHSVFGLGDEYSCHDCDAKEHNNVHSGDEPHQPNLTVNRDRNTLKWGWAVEAATAIPTMQNPDCTTIDFRPSTVPAGTVGLFEGADFYHCNAFRPEFDCKMRNNGIDWCRVCRQVIRDRLFSLTTLVAQGRTPLSVVARDGNHLDVFAVASDSRTVSDRWDIPNGWSGWSQLSGGATFPGGAGSPVTSISRAADQIDAFTVGGDGHIWTARYSTFSGWSVWFQIGTVTARAGSTVTPVARTSEHLDLFTTDLDGRVMWTSSGPGRDFSEWSHLSGGTAAAGATVTAVCRFPGHLDAFTIGVEGNVWGAWWGEASGWSNWSEVGHLAARPDSTVTVVARGTTIDLFTTAVDGRIMTTTWSDSAGWTPDWFHLGGFASPGSPVTAIARNPSHIDLFVVGQDRRIFSTWWDVGGTWADWFNVSGGNAVAGSQIAASARFPERLDIFVVGGDSQVYTAGWDPANGWSRWWAVGVT